MSEQAAATVTPSNVMNINELLKEIVKSLVDNPDAIDIQEHAGERTTVININVAREDIGKVIGKKGKIITSLRCIMENIAAKNNNRVNIHIID